MAHIFRLTGGHGSGIAGGLKQEVEHDYETDDCGCRVGDAG